MNDFIQMDIFFLVTTVAVIFVGVMITTALFYVIRILRSVERITQNVSEESDLIREDISHLRARVRADGFAWRHVAQFWKAFADRRGKRVKDRDI